MAHWQIQPDSIDNSMNSNISFDNEEYRWEVEQDESPYIEEVKREKDNQQQKLNNSATRKFCTIPDIVAIEILTKYGMDLHDPMFMHDHMNMKKLKSIITMEYPYLIVNNA